MHRNTKKNLLPHRKSNLEKVKSALKQLDEFDTFLSTQIGHCIGYPENGSFYLDALLKWWSHSWASKLTLNNAGDPFVESRYKMNTNDFERESLRICAALFHLEPEKFWGYITSGGTASNEQGLFLGREHLRQKSEKKALLYVSEEAHYSTKSLAYVLDLETRQIACQINGEMDYQNLEQNIDPTRPALMALSFGTTFKGAIDSIDEVMEVLKLKNVVDVHYHIDSALFGGFFPFIDDPKMPQLDFSLYPFDTIAISGHKFFGSPIPYGVFLTRKQHIDILNTDYIDYLAQKNSTIACSRSSLNSLLLWWTLKTTDHSEFSQEASLMLQNANYLYAQMKQRNWPVWLNPYSNTVFFRAPSPKMCDYWTLACMHCRHLGPLAHIVVMQHVDQATLDHFLSDLDQELLQG